MTDFPDPVGASSITNFFPESNAFSTASIHSFWPSLKLSKGKFSSILVRSNMAPPCYFRYSVFNNL